MEQPVNERKKEILDAALIEFSQKGIAGARMQSIAEGIGVTKAMIHYYFGTKEKLFHEVYRQGYRTLMGGLLEVLEQDDPLLPKIELFVERAIERFHAQPALTDFIVNELNRNPDAMAGLMRDEFKFEGSVFDRQLRESAENYEIASVDSRQVVANMISLCMFPYTGRIFMKELLNLKDQEDYRQFLERRKDIIADTIINWLVA